MSAIPDTETLLQAINCLRAEVQELRSEMMWKEKFWLTAEETCQVLGLTSRGYEATRPLKGLENQIKVQYTRPKLYRSKDVFALLERIDNEEIMLAYKDRQLTVVPLRH